MSDFASTESGRTGPVDQVDISGTTGRVAQTVSDLDRLYRLDTVDHVAVFESIQQVLSETLATVDDA